jgi:hypothetical protein
MGSDEHGLAVDLEPAHAEDKEVHRIRDQCQAHDDLKGARAQQQVDTRPTEYANGNGKDSFHQSFL